jgi:glutaredoxin
MPEGRGTRGQERGGTVVPNPNSRDKLTWAGIGIVLVVAYVGFWYHNNHRYDEFAKCMASKQVKMYGAYWCPHCVEQKEILGKSYRFVYVECGVPGSHAESEECKALGVKLFPTWRFPDGSMTPLVFSAQELSDKTGCSLP